MVVEIMEAIALGKATLEAINAATSTAKALSEFSGSDDELKALINDLTERLFTANQMQLTHIGQMNELKVKIDNLERQLETKAKYKLTKTAGGAHILSLEEIHHATEEPHSICPVCVEDGKRSILDEKGTGLICKRCDKFYAVEKPDHSSMRVGSRHKGGLW